MSEWQMLGIFIYFKNNSQEKDLISIYVKIIANIPCDNRKLLSTIEDEYLKWLILKIDDDEDDDDELMVFIESYLP